MVRPSHDRRCGLHSGIPECCVDFFVKHWRRWYKDRRQTEILKHHRALYNAQLHGRVYSYIACPTCLAAKKAPSVLLTCACYGTEDGVAVGDPVPYQGQAIMQEPKTASSYRSTPAPRRRKRTRRLW